MAISVAILTIGTELTSGLVPDKNSFYLSRELFNHGFDVSTHVSVPDDKAAIIKAVQQLQKNYQIIITSGGLGPTSDDITREAIADAFNVPLNIDNESLSLAKGAHPLEASKKLASFPKGSKIIKAARYMAGGFLIQKGDKTLISLPGVPDELKEMFHERVLPILNEIYKPKITLRRRLFKIANLKEVEIEDQIREIKEEFSYGLLPQLGEVHLYVTVKDKSAREADKRLNKLDEKITEIFSNNLFARDDETLEEVVVDELRKKGASLAVSESSTGGLVGERISRIAGASDIFLGGYITYAYELKEKHGIPKDLLMKEGAVNSEVAALMASQTRKKSGSEIAVSVTGIAGPAGGTTAKPIGLHYIGAESPKKSVVKKYIFSGNREQVRWQASQAALLLVREILIRDSSVRKGDGSNP